MLTPAEAERLILENIAPFPREDCSLLLAQGRVLRADLRADRDLPPFDRVTMDGYALRAAALAAGTRTFRVEGVQAAGMRAFKLGPGDDACLEIMTGAVLPEGADCVVPYEDTTRQGAIITVAADTAGDLASGNAIHRRGSDHGSGATIVRAGTRLTGAEIGIAAACGYSAVTVAQLPKIAIVSSGDELVEVDSLVAPHQIRRSNDYALRAALVAAGFPNVARFHLRDVPHEIEHLLWHVIAEFDVIVVTGGVSKGKFDHLPSELQRQGVRRIFQGVAQRPGKPLWFGVSARQTPVFALPGNPVSCYTCLHRYVLPALAHASGLAPKPARLAALDASAAASEKVTVFVPVTLHGGSRGELLATPHPTNTSGDFSALAGTDGCVELPPGAPERPAGTVATFHSWA
jgi:molybdopterin molybdotransferase